MWLYNFLGLFCSYKLSCFAFWVTCLLCSLWSYSDLINTLKGSVLYFRKFLCIAVLCFHFFNWNQFTQTLLKLLLLLYFQTGSFCKVEHFIVSSLTVIIFIIFVCALFDILWPVSVNSIVVITVYNVSGSAVN